MIEKVYKTTHGTYWDSEEKALVAEAIEQSDTYIDKYQMEVIVNAITAGCMVFKKSPVPKIEKHLEPACPTHEFTVDVNPILETKEETKDETN